MKVTFRSDDFNLSSVPGFGRVLIERVEKEFEHGEWRDNPYLLAEVHGIGFHRADAVAHAFGVTPDSRERRNAAAWHVLGEYERAGHTAMPLREFGEKLREVLSLPQLGEAEFDDSIYEAEGLVSRARTREAERVVAQQMDILQRRIIWDPVRPAKRELHQDQWDALKVINEATIFVLMGGSGTGKTRLIKHMASYAGKTELAAPTGKAAKRIEELSGIPAQTIHRLLGVTPPSSSKYREHPASHSGKFRFNHNRRHPLKTDLVIVDEASMLDVKLFADLCEALGDSRLVLVGDPFQLPSVGPGAVLRDLTTCGRDGYGGVVPNVELTELKRQEPDQLIARTCKSIRYDRRVLVDNKSAQDFFFFPGTDPAKTRDAVVDLAASRLPEKYELDPSEVMVLAPLRKDSPLSVRELNRALRARLNPEALDHWWPWTGDRVIQTRNNYDLEIFNGDTGTVVNVEETVTGEILTVLFDTPVREIRAARDDFDLDFAFALTVHKSQGSEWPAVIVVIDDHARANWFVDAQLIYTAISRARKVCVCIGSRAALDQQVSRVRAVNRWTRLGTMMHE